jgi:hypothetical protein
MLYVLVPARSSVLFVQTQILRGVDAMPLKLDGDGREYLEITATGTAQAVRTPKEGFLCSVKEGSQIALWGPHGFPEALIIVHPDDAPRLVYFDGTEETLTMKDGVVVLPPVVIPMPGQDATFEVGTFDNVTEWSEPQDPEKW